MIKPLLAWFRGEPVAGAKAVKGAGEVKKGEVGEKTLNGSDSDETATADRSTDQSLR